MPTESPSRAVVLNSILEARQEASEILKDLPQAATSPRQLHLMHQHGTPHEFAKACIEAIGEISILEALVAIRKYADEWTHGR